MSKQGPTNVPAFFNSAADFQAWVSGLHTMLGAAGMAQTGDTGQINPSSVAAPTTSNQPMGFEIWRFSDTLQSSVPIYIKFEYGSGAPDGSGRAPGLWMTVGSGTNGSGTLTGQISQRANSSSAQVKSAGVTLPTYVCQSSDGGDLMIASNIDIASNQFGMAFFLSRTRDQNGVCTNDGVIFSMLNTNIVQCQTQFISATGSFGGPGTNFPAVNPTFFG